ncbi:hypothetical protein [Rhodopila sp.]|uniref:hypothetical protein n=1 Tax=Rhodopila sp. TaxID=2480087 RepID=UPI002B676AD9|nr:hypothetical protein [Rhodopila sp.]HVZ07760.1 hypothetical protein [Rhodopila sp.]
MLASVLLASVWPGGAAPVSPVMPIRFPPGATSTTVQGAVARGEQAVYAIGAAAGQRMTVAITSVEHNAVFQLYRPGATASAQDGTLMVYGNTLAGAGEGDDAMRWAGPLPKSGTYLLVVGATRGGADYRLSVSITRSGS